MKKKIKIKPKGISIESWKDPKNNNKTRNNKPTKKNSGYTTLT